MAETADDLSTPLGQDKVRRKRRYRLPFTDTQALAVLMGLFLVVFICFAIFNDDPLGGEPIAHIALRQATPAGEKLATAPPALPSRLRNPHPSKLPRPISRPSPLSTAQAARAATS